VILSIDTTSEFGSIALTEANVVVEEVGLQSPEGFGHVLFGHIQQLLERRGTTVHQMECFAALASFGTSPLRATMIDARRGEIYGAVYNSRLELVMPEVVLKLENWLATLPAGCEVISTVGAPRALAAAIGHIAWDEFTLGHSSDPAEIDANYVRRSDAELFWKE
jgi:tRNA threonylcarbamoyladenosine biosynthesis protein TsaB